MITKTRGSFPHKFTRVFFATESVRTPQRSTKLSREIGQRKIAENEKKRAREVSKTVFAQHFRLVFVSPSQADHITSLGESEN